jgi:hypothetical protein
LELAKLCTVPTQHFVAAITGLLSPLSPCPSASTNRPCRSCLLYSCCCVSCT